MNQLKIPSKEAKTIAVFRALQLGDMLCSIPAIRALQKAYPNAQITLLGLPWASVLLERFGRYFNDFIHFPGYPALPEQPIDPLKITSFLLYMQHRKFDLVLQMQGNGSFINPMVELFAAKYTAGFYTKSDYCPDKELFIEYPEGISEIERHLALMKNLGIKSQGLHLEFPIIQKDEEDFKILNLGLSKKSYVCIHPGSRGWWRQWPVEHFASIADYCRMKGMQVVLTGTKDESVKVSQVLKLMKCNALDASGMTSLGGMAVLIKNARLLVSNCTGVSHMASALETPSVVISMDGEPERWGPLNKKIHRTIDWLKNPNYDFVLEETKHLLTETLF